MFKIFKFWFQILKVQIVVDVEQSKPWSTKGIDGTYKFLRKLFRLFFNDEGNNIVTNDSASDESHKTLNKALQKTIDDVERLKDIYKKTLEKLLTN